MHRLSWLWLVVPAAVAACSSTTTVAPGAADAAAPDADVDAGAPETGPGSQCTQRRQELIVPIAKVAPGAVSVVSDTNGVKKIFVDAISGGAQQASKNARVYVNLETGTKVALNDVDAYESTEWDLALRRTVIFTNSGDGGKGLGGAAAISKSFASVTAADADKADIPAESFFDADCKEKTDAVGGPFTTFSDPPPFGWYDYDSATQIPTPRDGVTYVVKGGTGKRYKVAILNYSAAADGGTGTATGAFLIEVSPL